jgi:sodium transport system permease protein
MSHFSRISTVWRKEFADTLRDRRTLLAMVLVPMVLYPALMLGSLQAFELQVGRLKQEEYTVVVADDDVGHWLQTRIDSDLARHQSAEGHAAEDLPDVVGQAEDDAARTNPKAGGKARNAGESARADVRRRPPPYRVQVLTGGRSRHRSTATSSAPAGENDGRVATSAAAIAAAEVQDELRRQAIARVVADGQAHVGVLVEGGPVSASDPEGSIRVTLVMDQTEIRSQIASAGLEGILQRANDRLVERRLKDANLSLGFIRPIEIDEDNIATPEKLGGSVLGQIVPLILVIMTITGAIYPAIDLTAGERERGTLETLMAAPVPKVDLIAGKFVVVASIGLLSAVLNLLSIGGTIYLGGLGDVLTGGNQITIPIRTLPLVLVVLIPLAVMFSAMLLAVCSFARSFKEAQNYVMPVLMVALIPAVIGVLPGTQLKGPLLILPVANIVILTRELFMGRIDHVAILWVTLSTSVYAAAAVAVAAKLFGQEAVLFADSVSIRAMFRRRFFKPAAAPSAAQALLLLALVFSLNFFIQQSVLKPGREPGTGFQPGSVEHLAGLALTLAVLFAAMPIAASLYMRVRVTSALSLAPPRPGALLAGLCIGASTWVLALAWLAFQNHFLPLPPELVEAARPLEERLQGLPLPAAIFFIALVPAFCEELFFRGYVLSGLRGTLGTAGAVLAVAFAFGVSHYSAHRLAFTAMLGVLLALLVVRWGSIWPAMIAHLMHNAMILLIQREGFLPFLKHAGFISADGQDVYPPPLWLAGAAALLLIGVLLCAFAPRPRTQQAEAA